MNTFAVDSLPASFPSRLMDPCVVAFSPAWFPRSVLGLRRFCYLLAMYFPQTLFTSLSTFSWNVPPRGDALRHQSVQMATLSNESDLDAQQYLADNAGSSLPDHQSAASSSDPSSLFPSDLRLMASFYALPPIPCLSSATTLWIFCASYVVASSYVYARQLGLGPFVIFRTRFMGLVSYLLS
jgi:hypothetical protein